MGAELTNVPHRIFYGFKHCLADGTNDGSAAKADWSAVFSAHCYLGYAMNGGWSHWWYGLAYPTDAEWGFVSGADEVLDFWWYCNCELISNTTVNTHFHLRAVTTDESGTDDVNPDVATGQIYDTAKDWTAYPAFGRNGGSDVVQINIADLPKDYLIYGETYLAGPTDWNNQDFFIRTGWNGRMYSLNVGDPGAGQNIKIELTFSEVLVRYHNPCVNSFSRLKFKTTGGQSLVLTGLGFDILDADAQNTLNPINQMPGGGWDSWVTDIQIINATTGAVAATLQQAFGDFVRDSNSQITIPAMPALALGTYWLRLIKGGAQLNWILTAGTNPAGYAGDWRTDSAGLMAAGLRFVIMVGKEPGAIIPFTDWTFKKRTGTISKFYSPIDIISPDVFYDGRIINLSTLTRGISSASGLFQGSDINIDLSNADAEFSAILAEYFLKNQLVKLYYAWVDAPMAWRKTAAILAVDNYSIKGPVFSASLRDISTKYFRRKSPLYRATADEFPNIHPNHNGRVKPEILGVASYSESNNGGAVEAIYVDTTTFKYLAARGTLHDVPEVYADGTIVSPSLYVVSYDALGQTFITFDVDQENKRVTFNAEGYSYAAWDSANGFVENPAYIVLFFLGFIQEIPDSLLNLTSFNDLATAFDTAGFGEIGKLILAKEDDTENVLKSLLWTFGAVTAFDRDGKFKIERKDVSDLSNATRLWVQIDCLEFADRNFGTTAAYNQMRARWDYSPAPDIYLGADVYKRGASILDFEETIEAPFGADFPWTTSETWVINRCEEELEKNGYGPVQVRVPLSLSFLDTFDLLDNIILQDMYGLNVIKGGGSEAYYYISGMDVDFQSRKLTLTLDDMSYLTYESGHT
jgi:hypothetical protein